MSQKSRKTHGLFYGNWFMYIELYSLNWWKGSFGDPAGNSQQDVCGSQKRTNWRSFSFNLQSIEMQIRVNVWFGRRSDGHQFFIQKSAQSLRRKRTSSRAEYSQKHNCLSQKSRINCRSVWFEFKSISQKMQIMLAGILAVMKNYSVL